MSVFTKKSEVIPPAEIEAIVMGASAGAVEALSGILPTLPRTFALPILIVVHVPPDHRSALPELFGGKCALLVKEAEDKEPIGRGTIYFAPPNYHLLVEQDRSISLSSDEPLNYSRPSIDVLFESAADVFQSSLAGVVLTGANSDGARGLRRICESGGLGLVQLPHAAEVSTMPAAALAACPNAQTLSLAEIAKMIQTLGAPTNQ